jgi:hypothetical protein
VSLGYLPRLSEQLQPDLVRLADAPGDRPSLGMSGEVRLPPERRHEFLNSLRAAIEGVLTQYGLAACQASRAGRLTGFHRSG